MFHKLFILATVALTVVNAHPGSHAIVNAAATPQTIKLKETYPPAFKIPTAKPEWLELIKNVNITKAPVYKNLNDAGKYKSIFTYTSKKKKKKKTNISYYN